MATKKEKGRGIVMKIVYPAALVLCALAIRALAQLEGGADRIPTRGPGPGGVQQATFFVTTPRASPRWT
jgi:hypothetical protein